MPSVDRHARARVSSRVVAAATAAGPDVLRELRSSPQGLSADEAA